MNNLKPAAFLVQTSDGVLHTYWNRDILMMDLKIRRDEAVRVYSYEDGLLPKYLPVSLEKLREGAA